MATRRRQEAGWGWGGSQPCRASYLLGLSRLIGHPDAGHLPAHRLLAPLPGSSHFPAASLLPAPWLLCLPPASSPRPSFLPRRRPPPRTPACCPAGGLLPAPDFFPAGSGRGLLPILPGSAPTTILPLVAGGEVPSSSASSRRRQFWRVHARLWVVPHRDRAVEVVAGHLIQVVDLPAVVLGSGGLFSSPKCHGSYVQVVLWFSYIIQFLKKTEVDQSN